MSVKLPPIFATGSKQAISPTKVIPKDIPPVVVQEPVQSGTTCSCNAEVVEDDGLLVCSNCGLVAGDKSLVSTLEFSEAGMTGSIVTARNQSGSVVLHTNNSRIVDSTQTTHVRSH